MQTLYRNADGKNVTNNKLSQQANDKQTVDLIEPVVCNGENMP